MSAFSGPPTRKTRKNRSTSKSNTEPSAFMIVGHACILSDEKDVEIPPSVFYTTTGICGYSTFANQTLNRHFIEAFFRNNPFFRRKPEDVLHLDPVYDRSPVENYVQKYDEDGYPLTDPTYIVVNKPGLSVSPKKYDFIFSYVHDGTWIATKSGIYRQSKALTTYGDLMTKPAVEISIKTDLTDTYITVGQIRSIYEKSIYPTSRAIIRKINDRLQSRGELPIGFKNRTSECAIIDLEYAVNEFSLNLNEVFAIVKKRPAYVYDPLCQIDCHMLGVDLTAERIQQTKTRKNVESVMHKRLLGEELYNYLDRSTSKSRSRSRSKSKSKIKSRSTQNSRSNSSSLNR